MNIFHECFITFHRKKGNKTMIHITSCDFTEKPETSIQGLIYLEIKL